MQHLNNLKIANMVFAGLYVLLGLAFGLIYIALGVLQMTSGDATMGAIFAVAGLVVGALLCAFGALFMAVGRKVADAQWRIGQTILAVMTIGSFPIGTLYGAYAIWVCWVNEETKAAFEQAS
jgi:hypothetical protein